MPCRPVVHSRVQPAPTPAQRHQVCVCGGGALAGLLACAVPIPAHLAHAGSATRAGSPWDLRGTSATAGGMASAALHSAEPGRDGQGHAGQGVLGLPWRSPHSSAARISEHMSSCCALSTQRPTAARSPLRSFVQPLPAPACPIMCRCESPDEDADATATPATAPHAAQAEQ